MAGYRRLGRALPTDQLHGLCSAARSAQELRGVAGAGAHREPAALVVLAPARCRRGCRATGRLAVGVVDEAMTAAPLCSPGSGVVLHERGGEASEAV